MTRQFIKPISFHVARLSLRFLATHNKQMECKMITVTIPDYVFWISITLVCIHIFFNAANAYYKAKLRKECDSMAKILNKKECK